MDMDDDIHKVVKNIRKQYPWWMRLRGPQVTDMDETRVEFLAVDADYQDWLLGQRFELSDSEWKWLIAGIRDGFLKIEVFHLEMSIADDDDDDPYEDDDPFEQE